MKKLLIYENLKKRLDDELPEGAVENYLTRYFTPAEASDMSLSGTYVFPGKRNVIVTKQLALTYYSKIPMLAEENNSAMNVIKFKGNHADLSYHIFQAIRYRKNIDSDFIDEAVDAIFEREK